MLNVILFLVIGFKLGMAPLYYVICGAYFVLRLVSWIGENAKT